MKFGSALVGGVRSVGIECCMVFLLLVLSRFDSQGGGVECVMGHLPYEVGMVTPYEGCVNSMFSGCVVSTGIIPGAFALVTNGVCAELSILVLALLVLMMSGLYVSVLMELCLQCHQIFSLIFAMLPHGALGMFYSRH